MVDLTWCTPGILGKISGWEVREDIESLSDHSYITMTLDWMEENVAGSGNDRPRWNWKFWNGDLFKEAIMWEFSQSQILESGSLEDRVKSLVKALQRSCDMAMDRTCPGPRKKRVYWWCEAVATARARSIRSRRLWTKAKIRDRDSPHTLALRKAYKTDRRELRKEINKAKLKAWRELIGAVEGDLWGLPYRVVLNKLRSSSFSIAESLEPAVLLRTLDKLFPSEEADTYLGHTYLGNAGPSSDCLGSCSSLAGAESSSDPGAGGPAPCPSAAGTTVRRPETEKEKRIIDVGSMITIGEVQEMIKRKGGKNTAPGMDGVRLRAFRYIPAEGLNHLVGCFNECLKQGKFPEPWKKALLVLIPKGWPVDESNPKLRPICLLDDVGKILETILVDRIVAWMDDNPRAQLSENQFGFRRIKSTCDALMTVYSAITQA